MKLVLWVVSAQNVTSSKKHCSGGFYVVGKFRNLKQKTCTVQMRGNNPIWNEELEFDIGTAEHFKFTEPLVIILKQSRRFSKNMIIGWNEITSMSVVSFTDIVKYDMKLLDRRNQPSHVTLNLRLQAVERTHAIWVDEPNDNPDTEGNDASMTAGYLVLNAFYAEGLPKMDAGIFQDFRNICRNSKIKKCVDPYLVATYDKKSIQTTVIHRTDSPIWCQRVNLGIKFPLKYGRIKLELFDRDYSSHDDHIATAYLELSEVSFDGPKGGQPCFGPAFVNFYGALREFRLLEISSAKDMNAAKVEGCAFRGRVFLSVEMKMTSDNSLEPLQDLGPDSLRSLKPYIVKKEYILRATFLNATLMFLANGEISFEVSIGTYGYTDHDSGGIGCSTWPEFGHHFEGSASCFMPWTEEKPTVVYSCEWEDVSYRLEAYVIACKATQIVKTAIWEMKQKAVLGNVLNKLHNSLKPLVDNFRCFSTAIHESPKTVLDNHLASSRLHVFEHILEKTACLIKNGSASNEFGDVLQCLESFSNALERVFTDPQIGIPDIFIWMLVDKRREAYCRISPGEIWYSNAEDGRTGHLCDRPNTYLLREPCMGTQVEENRAKAIIYANMWFGFSEYCEHCMTTEDYATYSAYMEIAVKSAKFFGLWTSIPDQFSPPRNRNQVPVDWVEDGDWYLKTMSRDEHFHQKSLWRRKLIPKDKSAPHWMTLIFHTRKEEILSPCCHSTIFLSFHESHVYQCKIYIHQARCLLANDPTGLSDPSANAVLLSHHGWTEHIQETLCPVWNTTVFFSRIILYGMPHLLLHHPPIIWIEVFDHTDDGVRTELIGETLIMPSVHLTDVNFSPSKLQWHPLLYKQQSAGEVLASADLVLTDDNSEIHIVPETKYLPIPADITPELQSCVFEVVFWGLRSIEDFKCPILEVCCEDKLLVADQVSSYPENNFQTKHFAIDMTLPKEDIYMPPLILKLKEILRNGQHRTLGVHVIKSISTFAITEFEVTSCTSQLPSTDVELDDIAAIGVNDADWWSKYYVSKGNDSQKQALERSGVTTLQYYDCELENVPMLQYMLHLPPVYPLIKGRVTGNGKSEIIGDALAVFYLHMGKRMSDNEQCVRLHQFAKKPEGPTLIRVYIVRAIDLTWKDMRQSADPYIVLKIGNRKISLKEHGKNNTLNPIFGVMSEFHIQLPEDRHLLIQVMDKDVTSQDDLIGETTINLEHRYLSPFRASCGLPTTFISQGPFQWRDSKNPVEILRDLCIFLGLPKPQFINKELFIGAAKFTIANAIGHNENGNYSECLALLALHKIGVVPEHVETRRLFLPDKPGQVQGRLELWVDIFPCSEQPGPPMNITVKKPEKMVLRCVIYNVFTIPLTGNSIFGGSMCDIYVKGWMTGMDDVQETDVHFRSLTGEGNFNWRFVFPFEYLVSHNMVVTKKKLHFWDLNECEVFSPPTLVFNVMDYDRFSMDDLLATVELDLHNMVCPSRTQKNCLNPRNGTINLFDKKRAGGFWPIKNCNNASKTGCVEMELELLTAAEAEMRPAGFGRNPPNENPILKAPRRPSSSFSWLKAPCRMLRYIMCVKFQKCSIVIILLITGLIILAILFRSFLVGNAGNFASILIG